MSISDRIVLMKDGVIQQIDRPQEVYDNPVNLFVAKFLGTPPINVFEGRVEGGKLFFGMKTGEAARAVLDVSGVSDRKVFAGVRPEGFLLQEDGPLCCALSGLEVMGRDISVVSMHAASQNPVIRSIISTESRVDTDAPFVCFALKPNKVFLFDWETEERILF